MRVDLSDQPKWVRPLHRTAKNTANWYYVKGEKTALAVQARIDHDSEVAVIWQGGSKAVHKTDWSSIIHSDAAVALMPDDDQPGHNAMKLIARILKRESYRWLTVSKQEWLS